MPLLTLQPLLTSFGHPRPGVVAIVRTQSRSYPLPLSSASYNTGSSGLSVGNAHSRQLRTFPLPAPGTHPSPSTHDNQCLCKLRIDSNWRVFLTQCASETMIQLKFCATFNVVHYGIISGRATTRKRVYNRPCAHDKENYHESENARFL